MSFRVEYDIASVLLFLQSPHCEFCNAPSWLLTSSHETAGSEEFAYESFTESREPKTSMDGFFTFVEGTLAYPTGPSFPAKVRLPETVIAHCMHPCTLQARPLRRAISYSEFVGGCSY